MFSNPQHFSCKGNNLMEFRSSIKKGVSAINQMLSLNYALEGKVDNESIDDFTKMMKNRMCVYRSNKEEFKENSKNFKIFTKKELRENHLEKYADKPILQMCDGITFMFEKFENKCQNIDEEHPENSDCILVMDVNGLTLPNQITTDRKIPKDRYYIYINAKENKAQVLDTEHQAIMYDKPIN